MPKPLVVIPTYLTEFDDVGVTLDAVKSVRTTAQSNVDVLLVDDGSPEEKLIDELESQMTLLELDAEVFRKDINSGFSKTVNVGLRRALNEGRHAILMNADVELQSMRWDAHFLNTTNEHNEPAYVVGALLCFPNGLIQHAGIYFSNLTRSFDHRHKFGPMALPEALKPKACPVTGALQFIRHECLTDVGLYDEGFFMGWEDVDYCLRVMLSGHPCIYNPNVWAYHFETMFRGRKTKKIDKWTRESYARLAAKYAHVSFENLVPIS